jgi:hypothetical protein
MFTDAEFMTAHDKAIVLKDWERFLTHSLQKVRFTKRLYDHLHLHCGFIAHYNIHGFYSTYFETGQDTERFFEEFCSYTAQNLGAYAQYDDLNTAMRKTFDQHCAVLMGQAEGDMDRRIALLDAAIQKAKTDKGFARQLLSELNM